MSDPGALTAERLTEIQEKLDRLVRDRDYANAAYGDDRGVHYRGDMERDLRDLLAALTARAQEIDDLKARAQLTHAQQEKEHGRSSLPDVRGIVGREEVQGMRLEGATKEIAALHREPSSLNLDRLRDVLCWVSQIFNGWRPAEEWSKWDEEVAQAVVEIQRAITKDWP